MQTGTTRKESIAQTSMEIFNEIGIEGFSIRELAKRQGITEAAIYQHDESKQDILLSIIALFRNFVTDEMQYIERADSARRSHSTLYSIAYQAV